jgi:hypothetical protein
VNDRLTASGANGMYVGMVRTCCFLELLTAGSRLTAITGNEQFSQYRRRTSTDIMRWVYDNFTPRMCLELERNILML